MEEAASSSQSPKVSHAHALRNMRKTPVSISTLCNDNSMGPVLSFIRTLSPPCSVDSCCCVTETVGSSSLKRSRRSWRVKYRYGLTRSMAARWSPPLNTYRCVGRRNDTHTHDQCVNQDGLHVAVECARSDHFVFRFVTRLYAAQMQLLCYIYNHLQNCHNLISARSTYLFPVYLFFDCAAGDETIDNHRPFLTDAVTAKSKERMIG